MKKLEDFMVETARASVTRSPHLRLGQFWANALHAAHPALARAMADSRYPDPFYSDSKLAAFFDFITDQWDKVEADR